MKHLIVYCHPSPKSFNCAVLDAYLTELTAQGQETVVRDLYKIGFDAILGPADMEKFSSGSIPEDIKAEQAHITWADVVTFIFPVWWAGLPAQVKGYVDRVFSRGFAYSLDAAGPKGLLEGKKAVLLNTTGAPEQEYSRSGMFKSMEQTIDEGIFKFCGMEILAHKYFCDVLSLNDAGKKKVLDDVKALASRVSKIPASVS